LVILLALLGIVRKTVWMPVLVEGRSMLPALRPGQIIGVNKLAYRRNPPKRGDLVLFSTGQELCVKRIIGLPGEEISVVKGLVRVGGSQLNERYPCSSDVTVTIGAGRIAQNQFVVAGDNRPESLIAVVNRERIVGRLVVWGK
jgi:signal peptidase I